MNWELNQQGHVSKGVSIEIKEGIHEKQSDKLVFNKVFKKSSEISFVETIINSNPTIFTIPNHLNSAKKIFYNMSLKNKIAQKFHKKVLMLIEKNLSEEEMERVMAISIYFLDKRNDLLALLMKDSLFSIKEIIQLFDATWKKGIEELDKKQLSYLSMLELDQDKEKINFIIDYLLTEDGFLNISNIYWIKTKLIKSEIFSNPSVNEQIRYVLSSFANNPQLVSCLERMNLDHHRSQWVPSLIRAGLRIPDQIPLGVHAVRKFILQALFSHHRQKEQGSCFAVFIPIYLKMNDLNRCLEDFEQLLKSGSLFQLDDNSSTEIPLILPKMSKKEKETQFYMDNSGYLYHNHQLLCHINAFDPIQGVCQRLGISLGTTEIRQLIQTFHISSNLKIPIILNDFLSSCAKLAHLKYPKIEEKTFFLYAKTTYLSYFTNILLTAWERTIASMSEREMNANLKNLLYRGIALNLFRVFDQKLSVTVKKNKQAFSLFTMALQRIIMQNIRFKYDARTTTEYFSSEGGYVLQYVENGMKWKNISSDIEFLQLMTQILDKVIDRLSEEKKILESDRLELIKALRYARDKKLNENFLKYIQQSIECEVLRETQSESLSMSSKPWLLFVGYDSLRMLEMYFGGSKKINKRSFHSTDPENALRHLLDATRNLQKLGVKTHSLPMRITGFHAFSLLFNQLNKINELNQLNTATQTVEKWELKAQQHASQLHLSLNEAEELFKKAALKWKLSFEDLIVSEGMHILNIKENIFQAISRNSFVKNALHLEKEIEEWIFGSLPIQIKTVIWQDFILFADTNWAQHDSDGYRDIYWGFFYNPLSRSVDFCQTDGFGGNIKLIDVKQFLNRSWDIFYY